MKADPEFLRRNYAAMSDDELLEIDPKDLVDAARQCYDEERARRKPAERLPAAAGADDAFVGDGAAEPEWLADGVAAFMVPGGPGTHNTPKVEHAGHVLRDAGIPVYLHTHTDESEMPPRIEYHVLVPGELSLHAASVLDKEIFNAEIEATWRAYFESLSDDELQTADTEMLFAGFRDRLKRVTKAYKKELARRGFEAASPPALGSPTPVDE